MNAIGMHFPQVQISSVLPVQTKTANAEANGLAFDGLLSKQQNLLDKAVEVTVDEGETKSVTNELPLVDELTSLLATLEDLQLDPSIVEDLKQQIEKILSGLEEESNSRILNVNFEENIALVELRHSLEIALDELIIQADEFNFINGLLVKLNNLKTSDDLETLTDGTEFQQLDLHQLNQLLVKAETKDMETIQKQLAEIFKTVETLLTQVKTEQDIKNTAPKLMELLQRWSQLELKLGKGNNAVVNTIPTLPNEETNLTKVWKDLIQSYERREQIAQKQLYNTDAKVTTTDVVKWLDKALENYPVTEKVSVSNMNLYTVTPISKLEQYVIHINQTQNSQSASAQLLDQFQQVMKTSKFLALPNGINQLSISLNPNNLGEMMVRLTQIDGEMTVKILVTTQAAKEMLEANIKQLKHMFSPQQVVIEKQDNNMQQMANAQKGQNDGQYNENEQEQSKHSEREQHHHDDGEQDFHELLMNVKV